MSRDPEAKRYIEDEWPVMDAKEVLKKIVQIADSAEPLSKFEADFLGDQAREAAKFGNVFRMSPKRQAILERIWNQHYLVENLATRLAAKITETEPTKEPPCPSSTSASTPPEPNSSKSSRARKTPLP